uniref:Immunoglobulin V-set domain-containing protein n=1 Tax=Astyanax mexicanus TaxID=7994 RepID=A0A8B9RIS3_ASTMX
MFLFSTGSSDGTSKVVQQIPSHFFKNQGESAEIKCVHNIQNYDRILWYKQTQNMDFTFIGYHVGVSGNLEANIRDAKISGKANMRQSFLSLTNLSPDTAAVYYLTLLAGNIM